MTYALHQGEHVRVDVLYARYSPTRPRLRVDIVSAPAGHRGRAARHQLSIPYVRQSWIIDEGSADPGGLTHRWVLKALIPLGFALLRAAGVAARGRWSRASRAAGGAAP